MSNTHRAPTGSEEPIALQVAELVPFIVENLVDPLQD